MKRTSLAAWLAPAVVLASFLAACSDRIPTLGGPGEEIPAPASSALAALACSADVRAGTVSCAPAAPRAGGASAAILGGQNEYVRVGTPSVSYDGVDTFRVGATVQNLIAQPLGTRDGTTEAPEGVRVLFANGITVTDGTGPVEIYNERGTGTFTGPGQPYFQYDTILQPGDVSLPQEWKFGIPNTVKSFAFTLYVAAPVPREDGWIDVSPATATLGVDSALVLEDSVRAVTGRTLPGRPVTWTSSDPAVAMVDANGLVTGLSAGTATITAADGPRTGSATITVSGSDLYAPRLTSFSFTPSSVNVTSGPASVEFTVGVAEAGTGAGLFRINLQSPSGSHFAFCELGGPTTTSGASATYVCSAQIAQAVEGGNWAVQSVILRDQAMNVRGVSTAELAARGFPTVIAVTSSGADTSAPNLTGFSFSPASVNVQNGPATVTVTLDITDAGTGVSTIRVNFRGPTNTHQAFCETSDPVSGTAQDGTFTCGMTIFEDMEGGTWELENVIIRDQVNNLRIVSRADAEAAGFPTTLQVTSPEADVTGPTLTAFSFSPTTVNVASGPANVQVTMGVSDAGTGVGPLRVNFRNPSGGQMAFCETDTPVSGTAQNGTFTCTATVAQGAEAGEWYVESVIMRDRVSNVTGMSRAELQAAGFPTTLTVTS